MSFNCTEVKRILSGSFSFQNRSKACSWELWETFLSSNDLSISSYLTSIAAGGLLSIHHPSISTVFIVAPLQPRLHYFQCHQNDKLNQMKWQAKVKEQSQLCLQCSESGKLFHDFSTQAPPQHFNRGKHFFSPRCTHAVLWEGLDVVTRQWRHINNEATRLNPACCCCRNRLLAGTQRAPLLSCRSVCLSWNRSRSPWAAANHCHFSLITPASAVEDLK